MAKKETAEQKLLKMIEASSGGVSSAEKTKVSQKQNIIIFVKNVNRVLIVVFLVAVVLVILELVRGQDFLSKKENLQINPKMVKSDISENNIIPSIPDLDYYLDETKKRNIFQPFKEGDKKNIVEVTNQNQRLADYTRNLKLVGISWFDTVDSASVMLEDVDKKITYFPRKGESIGDTGIKVKTIYADSVKLGHDSEEIIIRYE